MDIAAAKKAVEQLKDFARHKAETQIEAASAVDLLDALLEALEEAQGHMGEAWQEYRRLWLRWFEERVEKRYAKKREREIRQRLDDEIRAGRILRGSKEGE